MANRYHEELSLAHSDPLIRWLHKIIRFCVRLLAILMVAVIALGVIDVVYVLYNILATPPILYMSVNDILTSFGAFMVVLIAIEIFINIRLYLGTSMLPVKLVLATALMAVARKVIVLDLDKVDAQYLYALALAVVALGAAYWLISRDTPDLEIRTDVIPESDKD